MRTRIKPDGRLAYELLYFVLITAKVTTEYGNKLQPSERSDAGRIVL
jgi:hypothetical protein